MSSKEIVKKTKERLHTDNKKDEIENNLLLLPAIDLLTPFTFEGYIGIARVTKIWRYDIIDVVIQLSSHQFLSDINVYDPDGIKTICKRAIFSKNVSTDVIMKLTIKVKNIYLKKTAASQSAIVILKDTLSKNNNIINLKILKRDCNIYTSQVTLNGQYLETLLANEYNDVFTVKKRV